MLFFFILFMDFMQQIFIVEILNVYHFFHYNRFLILKTLAAMESVHVKSKRILGPKT